MSRLVIGPFNRVEGDLEVQLDIEENAVSRAFVVSTLYRGFENMLSGKVPCDALVYAPRICGICSVSQSVAAATAIGDSFGLIPPPDGQRAINLVHAAENIADHLTHFYMFFMPDFTRDIYANEPWFDDNKERFTALKGSAAQDILPARAELLHIVGMLAGKWPHSLSFQPGGFTKVVPNHEKFRLIAILTKFRKFLERTVFGTTLEQVCTFGSVNELDTWLGQHPPNHSDFTRFMDISRQLNLSRLGRANDCFMSYGAYRQEGKHLFSEGLYKGSQTSPLDSALITEDISHAWMTAKGPPAHPFQGITEPDGDMSEGYSWCKAPRLAGQTVEVGALARQLVNGHPLVIDTVSQNGGNVESRVMARLLELALVTCAMERWTRDLNPDGNFIVYGNIPDKAEGVGLVEAARGSLGHWIKIADGKIENYQIIAPTTWNFSPRDIQEKPGVLEQALVGATLRPTETNPVSVQHIVRSFDPCMVCTVH